MQTARSVIAAVPITLAGLLPQPAGAASREKTQIHAHSPLVQVGAVADQTKVDAMKAAQREHSEKLFTLLTAHYGAVRAYLDASIAKNSGKQSDATTKLISNAEAIASFLSSQSLSAEGHGQRVPPGTCGPPHHPDSAIAGQGL
jgi:hypothetical protein